MSVSLLSGDGSGAPVNQNDIDGSANNFIFVQCRLGFTSNYATNGDTLDLTPLASFGLLFANFIEASIESNGGAAGNPGLAGGNYQYLLGTTLANGKLKIFATAGTELGAGAYPASITGDVVTLTLVFRKLRNY